MGNEFFDAGFAFYDSLLLGRIALVYLLVFGGCIALYVMQSLGLYALAQRRCIKKPWLSWIPVGNLWIMGSLADQYQYVAKGLVRNRRKVILGLSIAILALYAMLWIAVFQLAGDMIAALPALEYMSEAEQLSMLMSSLLTMMGIALLMELVAIVLLVFEYIALYNIYCSSDPSNKVLYLVLSILLPFLVSVFLFVCRNRDYGMPPRVCDTRQPQA